MRSVIIFVLAALSGLAQSTPPGGGKVAAVVGPRGSGAPSMGCSAGMLYMRPGTGLYVCTTTDTWALLAAGAGSGDVVGPAASVDGEAAVYDGITGKAIKRFSGSGIGIFTSGVPSVSSALQWNATTGVGLIKPLTLGQFAGDIGTLNLNGTSARIQILPAAATAEWTLTLPANDGDANQVLQTNGSGVTSWAAAGAGDVAGPASSVDSEIAIFSGVGGKTLKRAAGTGIAYQTAGVLSALAVTDDALPVANGTGVDLKVLPSCSNATTSKLLYNSTTNAFSCGTDQGGSASAPLTLTGSTDAVQLDVIGHSTQTNPLFRVKKSDNTVLLQVNNDGSVQLGNGSGGTTLTEETAPSSPASGYGVVYADSTASNLSYKNDAGTVSVAVVPVTCSNQFARSLAATGVVTCASIAAADVPASLTSTTSVNNTSIPSTAVLATAATGGTLTTSGAYGITLTATATTNSTLPAGTKTLMATDTSVNNSQLSAGIKKRSFGAVFDGGGSALTARTAPPGVIPFACTISAWNIMADAGTATINVWKVGTGTAIPTVSNKINTSGVALASGTAIHSTTVTDFTSTTVTAGDMYRIDLTTVATATMVTVSVECDQ
jgi:hypothetical protein